MSSLKRLARHGRSLRSLANARPKGDRFFVIEPEGEYKLLGGPFATAARADDWLTRAKQAYVVCYDKDGYRVIPS